MLAYIDNLNFASDTANFRTFLSNDGRTASQPAVFNMSALLPFDFIRNTGTVFVNSFCALNSALHPRQGIDGSVRIKSADPDDIPRIDFGVPIDEATAASIAEAYNLRMIPFLLSLANRTGDAPVRRGPDRPSHEKHFFVQSGHIRFSEAWRDGPRVAMAFPLDANKCAAFLLESPYGERRGPGGVLYVSGTHMGYVLPDEWERDISSDATFLANMRAAQEKNRGYNFFVVHRTENTEAHRGTRPPVEVNVYTLQRDEAVSRVERLRERIIEEAA